MKSIPYPRSVRDNGSRRSGSCLEAIAALEQARRSVIALIRGIEVSPAELDQLELAGREITSLLSGIRALAPESPASEDGPVRPGEYVRVAIESAMEAMRRGDWETARRRADVAMWTARSGGDAEATWLVTVLQEMLSTADDPAAAAAGE